MRWPCRNLILWWGEIGAQVRYSLTWATKKNKLMKKKFWKFFFVTSVSASRTKVWQWPTSSKVYLFSISSLRLRIWCEFYKIKQKHTNYIKLIPLQDVMIWVNNVVLSSVLISSWKTHIHVLLRTTSTTTPCLNTNWNTGISLFVYR